MQPLPFRLSDQGVISDTSRAQTMVPGCFYTLLSGWLTLQVVGSTPGLKLSARIWTACLGQDQLICPKYTTFGQMGKHSTVRGNLNQKTEISASAATSAQSRSQAGR